MTLVPINPKDIIIRDYRGAYRKAVRLVEEFASSEHSGVEVKFSEKEYTTVASAANTYRKAVNRAGLRDSIVVVVRQNSVYLIKRAEVSTK